MNNSVIAACTFKIEANQSKIQLLPAHNFRAKDGRPSDVQIWKINRDIAANIINKTNLSKDKKVIDYDHQTLEAKNNGHTAPAAGWFKRLEWIDGLGLFALGVEWTDRAKQFIKNKEYRYISPVMSYDKQTGEITDILLAALVNYPAIDGMAGVSALSANKVIQHRHFSGNLTQEELSVCRALGITEEQLKAVKYRQQSLESCYHGLSDDELTMCRLMNISHADFSACKAGH